MTVLLSTLWMVLCLQHQEIPVKRLFYGNTFSFYQLFSISVQFSWVKHFLIRLKHQTCSRFRHWFLVIDFSPLILYTLRLLKIIIIMKYTLDRTLWKWWHLTVHLTIGLTVRDVTRLRLGGWLNMNIQLAPLQGKKPPGKGCEGWG